MLDFASGARFVFWTGGLDSSFRIFDLVRRDAQDVQPIYLIDAGRRSYPMEIETLSRLRVALAERFPGARRLAPTAIFDRRDFPVRAEIAEAFATLRSEGRIGSQYEWLAQFANDVGAPDRSIDMGLVAHDAPTVLHKAIFQDPAARPVALKPGPASILFRAFAFPLIDMRKGDIERSAVEGGFDDLLRMTWFCHAPVDGLPCGACAPCRDARVEREGIVFAPPRRRESLIVRAARKALRV
jgi:hypothetical protein